MKQYTVTGMSCAACQARVETAVLAIDSVETCSVSLLTNSMGVTGDASDEEIIAAVEAAGYSATVRREVSLDEESLKDTESPRIAARLISSVIVLLPIMYLAMGHTMLGLPIPMIAGHMMDLAALLQCVLTLIVMLINRKFFVNGFKGVIHRAANMDTLVALGSGVSFIYSLVELCRIVVYANAGRDDMVTSLYHGLYFESAAMILVLISLGKLLEAKSKGKTTDSLKALMKLSPQEATVVRDAREIVIPVDQVEAGDVFVVRPGESIPVDGVVIEGASAIDESALTGESIPVDKVVGQNVSAATINRSGYLRCQATRVGQDTTLSQIIQMVSDAAATKAPIAKIADKVSGVFVPTVIGIALVTFIVWMIVGADFAFSLTKAVSVLVISCPCALGLATPVAIMVGNGQAARSGILFKNSTALERTGAIQIIAIDKTGTITKGKPQVTDVISLNEVSDTELLKLAYALESKSEHPLATAIVSEAKALDISLEQVDNFRIYPGGGIMANYKGVSAACGNGRFIGEFIGDADKLNHKGEAFSQEGKTPIYFAYDGKLVGIIAVADVIKEDSVAAIEQLKGLGVHTVMLTGDNQPTASAIAKTAGVDEVVAGVLPDGKEAVISHLQQYGKVAMVGDGINDAPALTKADIGVAIGAGTDVAIDAADVVLMKSNLTDVAAAIRLSRKTLKNIYENLFWAFCYNVMGIPLAAGCFYQLFGWNLNPMFGAAAMSLSSFCVVTNALRLNLFKPYDISKDSKVRKPISGTIVEGSAVATEPSGDISKIFFNNEKGDKKMTTLLVEGMMCQHCEANVKAAIEELEGVTEAVANHDEGTVTVTTTQDISEDTFKAIIEGKGYTFKGIR